MTATIEPDVAMAGTARSDPELRHKDYAEALSEYLKMPAGVPDRILFCENSGADLTRLKLIAKESNLFNKSVEFLSFRSDCPSARGKGFAELDILDKAYDTFLSSAPVSPSLRIWKVTGRLIVKNLAEMFATAPRQFDLYADFRSVPVIGELFGGNDWVDTRFLAYTPDGYRRYLYEKKSGVGWTIEKSIFQMLKDDAEMNRSIVPRFISQPEITGVCAGSGTDYSDLGKILKQTIRGVARRAAPSLWL